VQLKGILHANHFHVLQDHHSPISPGKHHHLPHIHAKYAEFEASIGIGDGEILSGELPANN
jgi:hypothetical protein